MVAVNRRSGHGAAVIVSMFACLKAGRCYVVLDYKKVLVVDDSGTGVGVNEIGEFAVRSASSLPATGGGRN